MTRKQFPFEIQRTRRLVVQFVTAVAAVLILLFEFSAHLQGQDEKGSSSTSIAAKRELRDKKIEFKNTLVRFRKEYRGAKTAAAKQEIVKRRRAFESEHIAMAIETSKRVVESKPVVQTLAYYWANCKGVARKKSAEFLLQAYIDDEFATEWIKAISQQAGPFKAQEDVLRRLMIGSPNEQVKGQAVWALVRYLENIRAVHQAEEKGTAVFADQPEQRERRCMDDWPVDSINAEIKTLLTSAAKQWPMVTVACTDFGDPSIQVSSFDRLLGNAATARLACLERRVGMVAPEINGMDVRGGPMSLSQFRGKVVLLQFWSPFAPGDVPLKEQRRIAEALDGKPFAVVGVFQGPVPEDAVKMKMPFESFDDSAGKIRQSWNAVMMGESYLLDAQGKIVSKYSEGKALRTQIEGLLKEMGHDVSLRPKRKSKKAAGSRSEGQGGPENEAKDDG